MVQTVHVPDTLYQRLRRTADATHTSLDAVVERALAVGLPPDVDDVSEEFRDGLRALEALPDEDLWAVWRSAVDEASATRHHELLERHATGTLTPAERQELDSLRDRADGVLLRRAHAAALLRWRGYVVPITG